MFNKLKIHGGTVTSTLIESANEFLKDYEHAYIKFWCAPWSEDQAEIGAVKALEMIGKKYFGISEEAFHFIQYKVESIHKTQLKPID